MNTNPPPDPRPRPDAIQQLRERAEWWEKKCARLEERIGELEGHHRNEEDVRRIRDEEDERAAATALRRARAAAIRALVKLLPEAVRQAKAKPPRPALLRMILRATK
jgi:hypothetical protein